MGLALPAGQTYPAVQLPLQADVGRPVTPPKSPAAHKLHAPAPAKLYCPSLHIVAVALVLAAGHAYPGLHAPLQLAEVAPGPPHRPAMHAPLQANDPRPCMLPKRPLGHGVHTAAPPTLYCPALHRAAVALVDPAGQAYPGAHGPVQVAEGRAEVPPNRPAGQGTHTLAPCKL